MSYNNPFARIHFQFPRSGLEISSISILKKAQSSSSKVSQGLRFCTSSHFPRMDPFRTLTGGSRFDQQRFKSDIAHFDVSPLRDLEV